MFGSSGLAPPHSMYTTFLLQRFPLRLMGGL